MSGSPIRSRIALASRDSGGTIGIVENLVQSRWQPPLHHHAFDETFCILDGELTFQLGADRVVGRRGDTFHLLVGELTFQLGDERFTRRAGELAFAPRGVPHTYADQSGAPARALLVITPAGFERYFDRIAARSSGAEPPPGASRPIPEVFGSGTRMFEAVTDVHRPLELLSVVQGEKALHLRARTVR